MSFSDFEAIKLGLMTLNGKITERGIEVEAFLLERTPSLPNIPGPLFIPLMKKGGVPVAIECAIIRGGRIFLTPRDDKHFGTGWHLPGTYLVPGEAINRAIQRCLDREVPGLKVRSSEILPGVNHPDSLRFHDFSVPVVVYFEGEPGQDSGEWFDEFPGNLIPIHKEIAEIIATRLRGRR